MYGMCSCPWNRGFCENQRDTQVLGKDCFIPLISFFMSFDLLQFWRPSLSAKAYTASCWIGLTISLDVLWLNPGVALSQHSEWLHPQLRSGHVTWTPKDFFFYFCNLEMRYFMNGKIRSQMHPVDILVWSMLTDSSLLTGYTCSEQCNHPISLNKWFDPDSQLLYHSKFPIQCFAFQC